MRVCNAYRYIELRERSSIRFYKQEILQAERIFMLENEEEYQSKITTYVFRDLKLVSIGRKARLRHLVQSIRKPEVLFWYITWAVIWVVISLSKTGFRHLGLFDSQGSLTSYFSAICEGKPSYNLQSSRQFLS